MVHTCPRFRIAVESEVPAYSDRMQAGRVMVTGVVCGAIAVGVLALSDGAVSTEPVAKVVPSTTVRFNPHVAAMVAGVSRRELAPVVRVLSGEQSAVIGGRKYTFPAPRYSNSHVPGRWTAPIDRAEQYVYERMKSYGLGSVRYQVFPGNGDPMDFPEGRNVVGQITGATRPSEIIVIGCHLDVMNDATWPRGSAPGADDNASGCSAMLYVARSLTRMRTARTVRFIAFGAEENAPWTNGGNTVGSGFAASRSRALGENIVGMVSADGLAYNSPGSAGAVVEMNVRSWAADPGGRDHAIYSLWRSAIATYRITGITPRKIDVCADIRCGSYSSDNGSYWRWGRYPAALLVEEEWGVNHNPHWHTAGDRISTFDWPQYVAVTKSLVALTGHFAGVLGPVA